MHGIISRILAKKLQFFAENQLLYFKCNFGALEAFIRNNITTLQIATGLKIGRNVQEYVSEIHELSCQLFKHRNS